MSSCRDTVHLRRKMAPQVTSLLHAVYSQLGNTLALLLAHVSNHVLQLHMPCGGVRMLQDEQP